MSNEKQPKHFDSIRPDGICYYSSIQAHRNFCESLGNGKINPNYEEIKKTTQQFVVETEEQR